MSKILLFFTLIIGILIKPSTSASIECKYETPYWYQCSVLNNPSITNRDSAIITSISGKHPAGKSNSVVESFFVEHKTVNYIPRGLEKTFKNIKSIEIYKCNLKAVHQEDLKPFPKLVELLLWNNQIEFLEEDLFEFNPNLQWINFDNNKIIYMNLNVFDHLSKLKFIFLQNNTCINEKGTNSLGEVKKVIQNSKNKCASFPLSILQNLEPLAEAAKYSSYWKRILQAFKVFQDKNYQVTSTTVNSHIATKVPTTTRRSVANKVQITTTKNSSIKIQIEETKKWSVILDNPSCGEVKFVKGTAYNGYQTTHGSIPWNVAIINTASRRLMCGGTLLSKNAVITAGHCIEGKNREYSFKPEDFTIILGAHDISNPIERTRVNRGIKSVYVHHDYNPISVSYDADIGILILDEEVTFTTYIQPICLMMPGSDIAKTHIGFVTGFGKSEKAASENIAVRINVPFYTFNECVSKSSDYEFLMSSRVLCGGYANGTGACTGDSGSGLIVKHNNVHYLRGVVSSSFFDSETGCSVKRHSFFTDVLNFHSWITTGVDDKILIQKLAQKKNDLEVEIEKLRKENMKLQNTNRYDAKKKQGSINRNKLGASDASNYTPVSNIKYEFLTTTTESTTAKKMQASQGYRRIINPYYIKRN